MKILIIDDSVFSQQYTKKELKKHIEADFLFAASGEAGYDLYLAEKPDFVITDLLMAGMGGEETVRLIKQQDKNSKIIVLSSDIQKAVKEEIDQMGALMFINKPLNDEKVTALVNALKGI